VQILDAVERWPVATDGVLGWRGGLCLETRSREIMAILVNDVVTDAFRLGLYDEPAERVVKANGAPIRQRTAG
jgi:hypothetical protein